MPIGTLTPTTPRGGKRGRGTPPNPLAAGLPDPRPVTGYTVAVSEIEGNTRIAITLAQPCIIRAPDWGFVNCTDGSMIHAQTVTAKDERTIHFDFDGIIPGTVALVHVPYQDMQVQNFQGGFVRSGGQWFRKPE